MREQARSWALPAVVAAAGVLAGWALLASSQAMARSFSLSLYLLANVVLFFDFFDFVLRLYLRRANSGAGSPGGQSATSIALEIGDYSAYQQHLHLRPFAIVASVHNAEDSIDGFLESMQAHRERCWIIDDASTDDTVQRIRQAGWRCLDGEQNRKKPGAIRKLLEALPPEIETVVVVDPDISLNETMHSGTATLETVVFELQRSGMAALCPRIAIRPEGLLPRFQALEYCMSFSLGRMSLADFGINSGISVYRRSALAAALEQHSLSVYAEDFENSVILLAAGERIYYDSRLVVTTEGPRSLGGWFSQRVGWAFGLIKVYVERFTEIRRVSRRHPTAAYQFMGYAGLSCLAMQPVKIASGALLLLSVANGFDGLLGLAWIPDVAVTEPVYFVAAYAKYTLLAGAALFVAVPRGERWPVMPVVPLYFFYALLQIIPNTVGYANWISVRLGGSRLFADHYQDEGSLRRQHATIATSRGSLLFDRLAAVLSLARSRREVER